MSPPRTLSHVIGDILCCADAAEKSSRTGEAAADWRAGIISEVGGALPPDRPARPARPELLPPRQMPRRGKANTTNGLIALLHALAHIELNAIDLACDVLVRFPDEDLPRAFYDDWIKVADEEALHFRLLCGRLAELDCAYGDLPAHDGLWEAASETAHDLLARLAVVPLVLEARGLDVTPAMIKNREKAGDTATVKILNRIYEDEITHVAIGRKWFDFLCARAGKEPAKTWQSLVRRYYHGLLKPPFNHAARQAAGFSQRDYEELV